MWKGWVQCLATLREMWPLLGATTWCSLLRVRWGEFLELDMDAGY